MGQLTRKLAPLLLALLPIGCGKGVSAPSTRPAARHPAVASVVPAATDLILNMGAADHLAGGSNYEPQNPALRDLPRVGDYSVIDWERLGELSPDILIVSHPLGDFSQTFRGRAAAMKLQVLTIHIDRLEDIVPALRALGQALQEPEKAARLEQQIKARLEAVRQRVAGQPAVPALLVLDEQRTFLAGSHNYLDDLLTLAGGRNLAGDMKKDYPTVDAEMLLNLDPACIIQFLPDAPPQVIEAARAGWQRLPELRAVRNGRVTIYCDPYLLLPSGHVAEVCEKLADALHPAAATRPVSQP